MPLSERARVEVYVPDLPRAAHQDILGALSDEFTHTFGGCTVLRSLEGSYLSAEGTPKLDRINLIYADTPYVFQENFETVAAYVDELRTAIHDALEEESVLVVVTRVFHSG